MPANENDKSREPEKQGKERVGTDVHPYLRVALLVSILVLATYLFFHFGLHVYFIDRMKGLSFVKSFGPLSVLIFILLQVLQVLIAPLPGEATGIIGGYLYGPVMGTIYSTIGLTIGSWLAFALSRWLGLPFVEKVVDRKILQKYDRFMERQGALVTFAMFLIPGFPKDALCYIMGLSHMRTSLFLLVSTAGRLFGTVLLSVGGSCIRNDQTKTLYAILAFTAVVLVFAYLYRDKLLKLLGKKQPPLDSGKVGPDTLPDKSPDKSMDK
ncbi:MAG TPA: TVP38/TMEM64 family protein [Syntrophales bacterium]|nr:TVP38/TMEM64 family protein [Syntrophales bacterium]HRT27545.1 TVP38/TMEM64 family protein [Syntrophales bacterium]HRT71040.1 TVP38/TMEM64 family protein [Syntrophales bacterium]